jgi:hypothetical protein
MGDGFNIGNGLRWLVDRLEGCRSAFGPLLAELVVIVVGVLKLMPKGTEAGDGGFGLGPGRNMEL